MTDLSCDFTYIKWTILRIDSDFFYVLSLSYLKGLGSVFYIIFPNMVFLQIFVPIHIWRESGEYKKNTANSLSELYNTNIKETYAVNFSEFCITFVYACTYSFFINM